MSKTLAILASFSLVVGAASALAEQTEGEVIQYDKSTNTLTVESDAGKRLTFATNADTKVQKEDGELASMMGLQTGTNVVVTSDEDPESARTSVLATSIEIQDDAGPTMPGGQQRPGSPMPPQQPGGSSR